MYANKLGILQINSLILKEKTNMSALSRFPGESLFIDPMSTFKEFERMLSATASGRSGGYPPYDIVKVGEDNLEISFALAGFMKKDIDITLADGFLTIRGERIVEESENKTFLYRGIAGRKFMRSFQLPKFYEVGAAKMSDGILTVELFKRVPEEKKPKKISIN